LPVRADIALHLTRLVRWQIVLLYASGFLICIAKNKLFAGDLQVLERFVLSLFFGFVLLDQSLGKNSFIKMGRFQFMNYLGKISYGFYMYHLVVMFVLCKLIAMYLPTGYYLIPLYFVFSLAITIGVSALSYRFLESPILRLRPKDQK